MTSIQKVLIALDENAVEDTALTAGIDLAARHDASVVVLAVAQNLDRLAATLAGIVPKDELRQRLVADRHAHLEQLAEHHNCGRVALQVDVTTGVPFVEIIRKAIGESASIIVQCSQREESRGFSSSDWHLIRKSPVPVWIVRGDQPIEPQRLLVAIDVASGAELPSFKMELLAQAALLAARWGAHLTVLSAWELYGEQTLTHNPFVKVAPQQLQQLLDEVAYEARAAQDGLRAWLREQRALSDEAVSWHLEKGAAREVIPRFVNEHDIDLVMMGTLGRTGIPGLLIGNTAETVLSRIGCSVITLKPSPFVSPVK